MSAEDRTLAGLPHVGAAHHEGAVRTFLGSATALWLCMLALRGAVYGYVSVDPLRLPQVDMLPRLLLIGVYDFAFVVVYCLLGLAALYASRHRPTGQKLVLAALFLTAIVSLGWSVANVEIVRTIGRPLNYQWLYYSDFLQSRDVLQAIYFALGDRKAGLPAGVWYFLAICLSLCLLAWLSRLAGILLVPRILAARTLSWAFAIAAAAYLALGHHYLRDGNWERPKLENPVFSLLASLVLANRVPQLFSTATTIAPDDFIQAGEEANARSGVAALAKGAGIRNVVVFVMESVAAQYLEAYGGPRSVTPTLTAQRPHALLVSGIYAPAPATNFALLSLLTSVYPQLSYHALTEEHPDLPLASLSGELRRRGYRTGFFYSADLSYQNAAQFLARHSLDRIEDQGQRDCADDLFRSEAWPFLNTSDDVCTAASFISWLDGGGQPFLAFLWTGMTHYPYFVAGKEQDYGVGDKYFNRYLNALRRGDDALRTLIGALDERGLTDSTLIVVIGDHGEAFRQHGTYGHASGLFEENLHVPLVLINRRIFSGEEKEIVGGLIDVAPTILDVLDVPRPASWQGRSIFSGNRPPRYYFFSPWSDLLFGFREGSHKLIFNASDSSFRVYDLAADRQEAYNLEGDAAEFIDVGKQRLAWWVQYQQQFWQRHLGASTARP